MPEVVPNKDCLCMSCGLQIQDQYIYKVSPDLKWHESCLKCVECNLMLRENGTCFIKNGKPYCKNDYFNKFSMKCDRCSYPIKPNEFYMKSKQKLYHYDCFLCNVCNRKLMPGDEYLIKDDMLYCKDDAMTILNNTSSQLYLGNLNNHHAAYLSSTMAITPETSSVSAGSFSPSTSSSSSSSIADSPSNSTFGNNSSMLMSNNYLFNTSNPYNNFNINKQSDGSILNSNKSQDQDDDNSVSDNESDDLDDSDDDQDDLDDSIQSDDCSLNESANSLNKKKINKINKKKSKLNKKVKQNVNFNSNGSSLLQINNGYQTNHGGNLSSSSSSSSKQPRIRTVLNEKQLHTLRACYGANPRPDALMKEQLVEMTGLNPRVIRVWFQNKRCKDKKKNMVGGNRPEHSLPHLAQYHQSLVNQPHFNPNQFNQQQNIMFDNCI